MWEPGTLNTPSGKEILENAPKTREMLSQWDSWHEPQAQVTEDTHHHPVTRENGL